MIWAQVVAGIATAAAVVGVVWFGIAVVADVFERDRRGEE